MIYQQKKQVAKCQEIGDFATYLIFIQRGARKHVAVVCTSSHTNIFIYQYYLASDYHHYVIQIHVHQTHVRIMARVRLMKMAGLNVNVKRALSDFDVNIKAIMLTTNLSHNLIRLYLWFC